MGYFYGSPHRIDEEFRTAKRLSLRCSLEKIEGSPCYVVEAVTAYGTYTIWIDPQHGYNIAKAQVVRSSDNGDLFYEHGPMENERIAVSMNHVRFEKIGNLWVPMACDTYMSREAAQGYKQRSHRHHKRTEVLINPDHEALRSFQPDYIKDGARVFIKGLPTTIRYRWQKGELIPMPQTR